MNVSSAKPKLSSIPVHKLQERTDLGMEMFNTTNANKSDFAHIPAHRDDHYIFILQESGRCQIIVDFEPVEAIGFAVYYLLPGQVHHVVILEKVNGFFLAIDTALVDEKYRHVFEEIIFDQKPLSLKSQESIHIKSCVQLLFDTYNKTEQNGMYTSILHSLSSAFIGMMADVYQQNEPKANQQNSRLRTITMAFKKLLNERYKTMKSPSEYASELNISMSYLNEAVKSITGFPVSYWIHHEIILEAKRLLYYSDLNVKEIAFSLGYEDHTYFSRLFSKTVSISPMQFRKQYRE